MKTMSLYQVRIRSTVKEIKFFVMDMFSFMIRLPIYYYMIMFFYDRCDQFFYFKSLCPYKWPILAIIIEITGKNVVPKFYHMTPLGLFVCRVEYNENENENEIEY